MANPEHVEIVKQGAEAISRWREKNPDTWLDLIDAELTGINLRGAKLGQVDFRGATLKGADLEGAGLEHASLKGANMTGAILKNANLAGQNLAGVTLCKADLTGANLDRTSLHGANLKGVVLAGAVLRGVELSRDDLTGANLRACDLSRANLTHTLLAGADLSGACLDAAICVAANFEGAEIAGASFKEANLSSANLKGARGAAGARDLDKVRLNRSGGGDVAYFETCERGWSERWLDWEKLRTVGALPLFAASYSVLILIPVFFYGLDMFNDKVAAINAWAEQVATSSDTTLQSLAAPIRDLLHKWPIPGQSLLLLISTFLLATASTIYTFACPSRIKEFSRDQWVDQLGHSLIHYWSLSWKRKWLRLIASVCYALGGAGILWIILTKLWRVAGFIVENSELPWWPF